MADCHKAGNLYNYFIVFTNNTVKVIDLQVDLMVAILFIIIILI